MKYLCSKCSSLKNESEFYKNSSKQNGLESQCKSCVLERKAKKYKIKTTQKKKTKQLRLLKRVNVLDPASCTLDEKWINRPQSVDRLETIKKIFEELS